jgi:hypothetical protein
MECKHALVRVPRNHDLILLSQLRLPKPGGPGLRVYIPQEQSGQLYPRALGSFDSQGYGGGIVTRLHTSPI